MAPILTSRDSIPIWGGIFLPRLLCGAVMVALYFTPRGSHLDATPSILASATFLLTSLAVAVFWIDWRLPGRLLGLEYKVETLSKLMALASASSAALLTREVNKPDLFCRDLCVAMVVGTLAWELLNMHLVPDDWKFQPLLNNKMSQGPYILWLFTMDFFFICFMLHIVTYDVVNPWRNFYKNNP